MKKIKKLVAVVLLSLTLFNSILSSYSMTVQAAEAIPMSMTALEALLALFGLELGLGNQHEFISNSAFTDFATAVSNGETVSMPSYGKVNFSDGESVLSFMTWASALSYTAADGNILTLAKMLDSASYKNSGTSATTAMEQQISVAVGDYNGSSEALADDVKNTFTVITGGSSDNGNNNMTPNRWDLFTAIMSCFLFGASETFNEFVDSLSVPEDTEYQEYASAFDQLPDCYFNGSYTTDSDGNYVYKFYSGSSVSCTKINTAFPSKIVGVVSSQVSGDMVTFYTLFGEGLIPVKLSFESYRADGSLMSSGSTGSVYMTYPSLDGFSSSSNFPIFNDSDTALNALLSDDFSSAENLLEDVYSNFKKTAPTASATLSSTIDKWMDTEPTVDDVANAIPGILEVSDTVAGTGDALPSVNEAIAESAGVDIDSDPDAGTATGYMGILERILAAIQFFNNPFTTILTNWRNLLQWLYDFNLWIEKAWADLLAAISSSGDPGNPNGPIEDDGSGSGGGALNLLNGFLLLIGIFFILLRIFLHLLEFIINIFRIPANPGFITGDFAIGFEYIKSVQLSPLNMSVYDFLMGLVHILVLFSVVKVLKKHIDKIHI